MLLYSAHPLEQVRRTAGLPRAVPLTETAAGLVKMARRLDPAGLAANELGEAERILSGIASALEYERLRTSGLSCVEGWDQSAPVKRWLPVAQPYRLRAPDGYKAYVTEPRVLGARALAALAELASLGWGVTVEAAGALSLPGQTLHVVIRPRPVAGRTSG
jgi:hypothetical protein